MDAAPEDRAAAPEEERRLFYVGLTRAADSLYCSYARQRPWQGKVLQLAPSPLLEAVRAHCKGTALRAHTRATTQQLQLL